MKRILKILKISSLVLPVLLLISFIVYNSSQKSKINGKMQDANGLVWKYKDTEYHVEIEETSPDVETHHYVITVINTSTKKPCFVKETSFNFDMYGGGFVKAVQADSDPELEIISWGQHEGKQSFLLDFSAGTVVEIPLSEAPGEMKELAHQWYNYNIMKNFEVYLIIIILISYYILYGIIWGVIRLMIGGSPKEDRVSR